VTPDELEQSKKILHNMLLEYVDNEENSVNLLNREKSLKMLNRIIGSAEAPTAPDLRSIKGLEDEIMNKVIHNYEMESFSPMKGLLFGNLMTVMLIQMQKMKMHMEAALLTMDQVLTSNELTMAATAAIPGIAISCLVGYSFYWMFVATKAPRNKSSEQLQLRLAFGDIERAIDSLMFQVKESDIESSAAKACLQGPSCLKSEDVAAGRITTVPCPPEQGTHQQLLLQGGEEEEGGINNLARDELLLLRYNGLLIFQVGTYSTCSNK
jgi:hypothetical protein